MAVRLVDIAQPILQLHRPGRKQKTIGKYSRIRLRGVGFSVLYLFRSSTITYETLTAPTAMLAFIAATRRMELASFLLSTEYRVVGN